MAPHTYGYDAAGLWVRLTTRDHTCWRYWGGGRVVNELRVSGDAADDIEVTWVGAAGSPLAEQVVGPGERLTLLAAAAGGSVLLEADTAVRSVAYAPHGHRDDTSALAGPAFNGEHLDAGSGCYLLGAGHHRPYSPTLGLFLAPDTASPFSAGGLNTLAYCAGDPINRSDPSGHFWKWLGVAAGILVGVAVTLATAGAAGAAVGALAAGGIAALTKSGVAAIAATTLGVLSVGTEVGSLAAYGAGDDGAGEILGWVGLGLGIAGAAPALAKTAMKGAARFARFAQRAMGTRSSAIPVRGAAAGSGRAAKAALAPATSSPAASSQASRWYANKATYLTKFSRTFTTYPVSTPPARAAGGRPAFGRQMGVHPDAGNAAEVNAIVDDLANPNCVTPTWDWTPPPLKQYPSPAYTTGHLAAGDGARRQVDVAGHISFLEATAHDGPSRVQRMIRSLTGAQRARRDLPPSYKKAMKHPPSYELLDFDN
jgi:RHS repeat-associated protein